jgi:hypothetical protein
MTRIVYLTFPDGSIRGGQKMLLRHVETLRELGFDAVCWTNGQTKLPAWFEQSVPVEVDVPLRGDDIIVAPEDAYNAIAKLAEAGRRPVIFCQGTLVFGSNSLEALDLFPADRFPPVITVGRQLSTLVQRCYPQAAVEFVPCFADERVFRPEGPRSRQIACVPHKRPHEAQFIQQVFRKLHPAHAARPWRQIQNATEAEVAEAMRESDLFLSLSKLEAVGLTPLEAMASGCLCVGFTGIGGRDFATAENGFWVEEDDCLAAVDALARAADLLATGGPRLQHYLDAGLETAREWSYARFRSALEATWMRLAPEARVRNAAPER